MSCSPPTQLVPRVADSGVPMLGRSQVSARQNQHRHRYTAPAHTTGKLRESEGNAFP